MSVDEACLKEGDIVAELHMFEKPVSGKLYALNLYRLYDREQSRYETIYSEGPPGYTTQIRKWQHNSTPTFKDNRFWEYSIMDEKTAMSYIL